MEDTESFEDILENIKKLPSVTGAVLMTKTGLFVLGSVRKSANLDKFIGMAAILMGSAEAASMELEDQLKWVVIQTKNAKLAITNVSDNILLAVTLPGQGDAGKTLEKLEQILTAR